MPTSYYGQDPYAPTNVDPGYATSMYPSTGGVNNDTGMTTYNIGDQFDQNQTYGDPNQTMQTTAQSGAIQQPPDNKDAWRVCFDPSNPMSQKQWCQDIKAQYQPYLDKGKLPPIATGGDDSTWWDGTPTTQPPPAGTSPWGWTPPQTPQYPGGTPNVDPYDIGSSPDYSGFDFEGISPVNPQASPFDYGQVSDFADAAWNQSMRYLEPQFQTEDRRFEQMLINKGLDPNSEAGMEALRRKEVGQNDLLSKSAFDALGFGTDLQNQMFGQDATRSGFANDMMQALMGLGQRGHEFDTTAGLNANQQAFAQMLALEGLDYRDYMTLIDQMRYDDSLALSLLGMGTAPSYQTVRTGLADAPYADYSGAWNMWDTPLFGGR